MLPTTKQNFITRLYEERDRFELLVNRVGFARRLTLNSFAGKRSVKDMIALIWAYEQFLSDRMFEITQGHIYSPSNTDIDYDAFQDDFGYPDFGSPLFHNSAHDWVVDKFRNVSLDDLVMQELQAFSSIIASLEKMPERLIHENNLYARIANFTFDRYRNFEHEIRHWLKKNGIQPG